MTHLLAVTIEFILHTEAGISLECSIDVQCTLFFMSPSNTENLFLGSNVDIHNLLSCSVLTSYVLLENH
jgi:hypothetical protein